jgi:hypothetical protein
MPLESPEARAKSEATASPNKERNWVKVFWRFSWLGASVVIYVIAIFVLMWAKDTDKPTLAEQLERLNQPNSWSGKFDGQPIYFAQPAMLRIDKANSSSYILVRDGQAWTIDEAQQRKQKLMVPWVKPTGINFAALFGIPKDLDITNLKAISHQRVEDELIWTYQLGQANYDLTITLDSDDYRLKKIEVRDERPGQPADRSNHTLVLTYGPEAAPAELFQLKATITENGPAHHP